MTLGDNIKRIRKDKKMTQEILANELGISRSYLGDLENNRRNPSSKTLEKLSNKLDVSIQFLLTGHEMEEEFNAEIEKEALEKLQKKFDKNINDSKERIIEQITNNLENFTKIQTLSLNKFITLLNQYEDNPEFLIDLLSLINFISIGKNEFINDDIESYEKLAKHAQTKVKWMLDKLR